MIILDTSVATKWFVPAEPLAAEAERVLDAIAADPQPYAVPELFMNELLVATAALGNGVWLTADGRAARKIRRKHLVRVLGR